MRPLSKIAQVQMRVTAVRARNATHFAPDFQRPHELERRRRRYVDPRNVEIPEVNRSFAFAQVWSRVSLRRDVKM
jgi:hypothetical protein